MRCIDAFVAALDLAARGFRHAVAAATGCPSAHPGALLKLYKYGSLDRLRSSRRLEQETQGHVELMWRLKTRRPDHTTIAHVRRDHLEARREVCRALTLLCKPLDLFGGAWVAIDGRQLSAVHAKGRHVTNAKLAPVIAQIDARVAGYLTELEAADDQAAAGTPGGARAAALQTKIAALRGRRRRAKDLQAALERRGQEPRSLTAPDSPAMKGGHGRGTAVCDHVQTAVEAPHTRIVAGDVANDPTDRDWLSPVVVAAKAVLGGPFAAVADVGSDHGQDVKPCRQAGMTPDIARPITSATQQLGRCSQDDCTDEAATDTSRCPAGERRSGRFDTVERGRHSRSYATSAGRTCALQAQCTRHQGGRRITRGVDEPLLEQLEQRLRARPEIMPQRQALVEHPFGTMKRGWEQGYVLRRGLARVRAECSWTGLADNLRRVLNLVAMPRLLASVGSGGQGMAVSATASLRMREIRTSSRPLDRFRPLSRLIKPSAMSFYTVWRCT